MTELLFVSEFNDLSTFEIGYFSFIKLLIEPSVIGSWGNEAIDWKSNDQESYGQLCPATAASK